MRCGHAAPLNHEYQPVMLACTVCGSLSNGNTVELDIFASLKYPANIYSGECDAVQKKFYIMHTRYEMHKFASPAHCFNHFWSRITEGLLYTILKVNYIVHYFYILLCAQHPTNLI